MRKNDRHKDCKMHFENLRDIVRTVSLFKMDQTAALFGRMPNAINYFLDEN